MSSETITRNDLENILNGLGIVSYEKNVGYGDGVSITSYTSASNPYTCPSDGIIIIGGTYRSGHYIILYDAEKGYVVAETASGGSANDAGNTVIPTPVFKGQKFYVTQTSGNYCTASFIPFTKEYPLAGEPVETSSNYIKIGGIGICWGLATPSSVNSQNAVTFPITFSSAPTCFATFQGDAKGSTYTAIKCKSVTTTGMTVYYYESGGAVYQFSWLAIGTV